MLKFTIHFRLALACCCLLGLIPSNGQTASAPASTNAATTNAPAAAPPLAIPVGDVVAQAQATTTDLQNRQTRLDPDPALQAVSAQLPDLKNQIENQSAQDAQMLKATPSLSSLQMSQAAWLSISDNLASAQISLSDRVRDLDQHLADLDQMDAAWKATLDAANKTKAPPEIVQRIQDVRALVAETRKAVVAHQMPLYAMQDSVAAQDKLTQASLETVKKAMDTARAELFERNHPMLWDPAAFAHPAAGVMSQEKASFDTQLAELKTYLDEKIGAVLIQLLLLAILILGFYWIRNTIHAAAREQPALLHTARVLDAPLATALLATLLATWFFYPDAPRLLWAVAGAIALIPAVIIIRRLIDPANFPILYATMVAYFIDQVRYVVTPAGILSRFLFIAELLAAGIFLLIALRSKHLTQSPTETLRLRRFTRLYLHFTFSVLVFAGFANVLGYIPLSILAGNGMLESSYLAVILYAAVRIVDALAISALSIPPLSKLGMVRRHHDLIYKNITAMIRWAFFGLWLVAALQLFSLRDPAWQEGGKLLAAHIPWFSLDITVGAVVAFPITIWASFLISRFLRFVLREELYPHLQLGRGIPYAASTMVHYTILLLGFFAAVAATGAQLSQFAFLAGAFGVGLGFGLQNIMNNFVSGVILLFERPIKVGDTIQIGTDMGTVKTIGIRASIILLTNGSEMIVPNGNLISNPVTNWTLSNCERLIEIPLTVTSKVDPKHIIDLLNNIALTHPDVLKNPAPNAILVTFGASLTFRLRAWIDSVEEATKVTSDLSLAINSALEKENIVLG